MTSRRLRILSTRQMYRTRLYSSARTARTVKAHEAVRVTASRPKLSRVAAMEPRMMENSSHARKVRSAAK